MSSNRSVASRIIATVLAALVATVAIAPNAWAGEVDNPWSRWVEGLGEREQPYMTPLVVIVSLPAMLVITPFWLGQLAIASVKGNGDEGDDEE
jgi:hypothetical protein